MRTIVFIFLTIILIPGIVLAADDNENQQFIFVDENGEGWELQSDGSYRPFELEEIEALATRPPPKKPGFCINGDNFTLWYGQDWHVCTDEEWEAITEPTLSVLPGAMLMSGDFISSDSQHKVEAVIDDVEIVEIWASIAQNGFSGTLSFNPKIAKKPTVTFHPNEVPRDQARGGPLSFKISATIGPLMAQSPVFTQNALHRLRQEYVDLGQDTQPEARDFHQTEPAYPNLADPDETHEHHDDWRIINLVNQRANQFVAAATTDERGVYFTSGYRCPVQNRNRDDGQPVARESAHIYGRAFDFDAQPFTPDTLNSRLNYELWDILRNHFNPRPVYLRLYNQHNLRIELEDLPDFPTMPPGVTIYRRGHVNW